jgi:hypothetical protein
MATLYFRSTGANWGTAGDWSTTPSPVYTGGSVPTAADDVIFEAASANCIVNTSNRVCKSITFATYTNEIQMSFNITVSGAITFGASMQVHPVGSGSIGSIVTSTITPNGFAWPNTFTLGGTSQTYTLASNMTLNGQLTCSGTTAITINANTLTCNNGAVFTISTGGTTTIELKGGNWSGTCNNTVNLNSTGTITLTGSIGRSSGTLTYVAGTINNSGNWSLSYTGGSINVGNNIIWGNITMGTGTITLVNNLHTSGILITGNGGIWNGAYTIYCTGITQNNTTNALYGTATVELTGTGTWQHITTSISWGFDTVINCGAGTLTINTARIFGSSVRVPTLTYTSGTVNCLGVMQLFNCILATNGMAFNNLILGTSSIGVITVTLTNNLTVVGDCTLGGNGALTVNGNTANIGGSLINAMVGTTVAGTTIFNMNGTGNIQTTGTPTSWTSLITINSPAGTITWLGTNGYGGNLTYTAGTIVSTSSIINRNSGTMTINASGFNLGTLNLTGTCQFLGTNGFTITNLNCTTAAVVSRWTPTNEYIITNSILSGQADGISKITYTSSNNAVVAASFATSVMTVTSVTYGTISVGDTVFGEGIGTGVKVVSFGSGSGGVGTYNLSAVVGGLAGRTIITSPNTVSYPKITLNNGATQSIYYTNAIDIDSNNGQTIWSFGSKLLRAFNWNVGTKPNGFSFAWVR